MYYGRKCKFKICGREIDSHPCPGADKGFACAVSIRSPTRFPLHLNNLYSGLVFSEPGTDIAPILIFRPLQRGNETLVSHSESGHECEQRGSGVLQGGCVPSPGRAVRGSVHFVQALPTWFQLAGLLSKERLVFLGQKCFHQRRKKKKKSKLAHGTGRTEKSYLKITRLVAHLLFRLPGKNLFQPRAQEFKSSWSTNKISPSSAINIAHMCHFADQKGLHRGTIGLFPNGKLFLSFFFFLLSSFVAARGFVPIAAAIT